MKTPVASPFRSCKRLGLPFYRCPSSASVVLGILVTALILVTHVFVDRMKDFDVAMIIEIGVSASLLLILFLIISRLQRDVERAEEAREHLHEIEGIRNEFTNIASQDIAEACTAIKWGIRTLEPAFDLLAPNDRQTLMRIRDRNDHILDVVRNLIILARIERKEVRIAAAQTDLHSVIENLLAVTSRRTKAHGTQVIYVPPPTQIFVNTDHIVLSDILQSLYAYSLERTRGVSDAINIRAFMMATGEANVARIIIADNAPPVPEHMRKDIFARVIRNPTTGEMNSTSLGPHVAHELAAVLGVELTATTTDDQTSFAITFPPAKTA